jgi:hypothetical protein
LSICAAGCTVEHIGQNLQSLSMPLERCFAAGN